MIKGHSAGLGEMLDIKCLLMPLLSSKLQGEVNGNLSKMAVGDCYLSLTLKNTLWLKTSPSHEHSPSVYEIISTLDIYLGLSL